MRPPGVDIELACLNCGEFVEMTRAEYDRARGKRFCWAPLRCRRCTPAWEEDWRETLGAVREVLSYEQGTR